MLRYKGFVVPYVFVRAACSFPFFHEPEQTAHTLLVANKEHGLVRKM